MSASPVQHDIDSNIQSYDLNKYLASLYSVNAINGQTTNANSTNPANPSSGWNGVIGAITQQVSPTEQRNAIGSPGAQANDNLAQSEDGAPPQRGAHLVCLQSLRWARPDPQRSGVRRTRARPDVLPAFDITVWT